MLSKDSYSLLNILWNHTRNNKLYLKIFICEFVLLVFQNIFYSKRFRKHANQPFVKIKIYLLLNKFIIYYFFINFANHVIGGYIISFRCKQLIELIYVTCVTVSTFCYLLFCRQCVCVCSNVVTVIHVTFQEIFALNLFPCCQKGTLNWRLYQPEELLCLVGHISCPCPTHV